MDLINSVMELSVFPFTIVCSNVFLCFVVKSDFGEIGGERLKEMQFSDFTINLRNTLTST